MIYRGKTVDSSLIAEMAESNPVKRLIRAGQRQFTTDVQQEVLSKINGRWKNILEPNQKFIIFKLKYNSRWSQRMPETIRSCHQNFCARESVPPGSAFGTWHQSP